MFLTLNPSFLPRLFNFVQLLLSRRRRTATEASPERGSSSLKNRSTGCEPASTRPGRRTKKPWNKTARMGVIPFQLPTLHQLNPTWGSSLRWTRSTSSHRTKQRDVLTRAVCSPLLVSGCFVTFTPVLSELFSFWCFYVFHFVTFLQLQTWMSICRVICSLILPRYEWRLFKWGYAWNLWMNFVFCVCMSVVNAVRMICLYIF